ncbi:unnamed protein product [Adineta steineri]|uniref:G-protein coupled receptors family 1 profile domain-containing protein n=1 Tax=Adineta steineri TaxID=433720 RepID=A0A818UU86_9BILA|nr:unnamed protein product [Adineta steineri]CAF1375021.1 unnamed protein product [Adineta steineri]CAF3702866.1 unnamed protein product [Adineta steineri]CAF3705979.1 unnamed protein product [Adineta steineri]
MAILIGNNTTLALDSDDYIRNEINQYVAKLNFILIFVQSFVSISGIFGNMLALIVINKKSLRNTSSAVYITYMAIFDSAVLLLHCASLAQPRRNLFIHCSLIYLTDLFSICANWVLVIITLERCVAVASPFLAKRFCTVHSARYSVYILISIAILLFSATFPIIYHTDVTPKRAKCKIRPAFGLIHRIYQPIVFYVLPDILLLSNLFTVYSLIQRRRQQKRLSNDDKFELRVNDVHSNRKQRQLTIMLVTVNFTFYLFSTPALIFFIGEYTPPKHPEINKLKRSFFFTQTSVLLLQLHHATNFIFYCFTGRRFREATIETFNQCSTQLKIFYHRYFLCDKYYRVSSDYQMTNIPSTNKPNRLLDKEYSSKYTKRTTI